MDPIAISVRFAITTESGFQIVHVLMALLMIIYLNALHVLFNAKHVHILILA